MLRFASFLLAFVFMASPVLAEGTFKTPSDAKRWLKNYYRKPDPNRIPELVGFLSSSGMLDQKNAISPIFGFLSGVFHDNLVIFGRKSAIGGRFHAGVDGATTQGLGLVGSSPAAPDERGRNPS